MVIFNTLIGIDVGIGIGDIRSRIYLKDGINGYIAVILTRWRIENRLSDSFGHRNLECG